MRKFFVVGVVAMVISSAALAAAQDVAPPQITATSSEIEGLYRTEGVVPNGKAYKGLIKIVRIGETTYQLGWIGKDRYVQMGIGILKGDTLSVGFFGENMPAGVILYHIKDDSQMLGEWAILGADGVYPENLTKLDSDELKKLLEQEQEPELKVEPGSTEPGSEPLSQPEHKPVPKVVPGHLVA